MGWGTTFNCEIFLSKLDITSEEQLKELIKDRELYLTEIKQKLAMLVSSNPRDIIPDEWKDEPINYLYGEVDNLINEYTTYHEDLIKFEYCLANYSNKIND